MSKVSPTNDLVLGSLMIGRVKKSLPSANLREAGTLRLLRTSGISGICTHVVEYGRPLKLSASRLFHGFAAQQFFSVGGAMAMS